MIKAQVDFIVVNRICAAAMSHVHVRRCCGLSGQQQQREGRLWQQRYSSDSSSIAMGREGRRRQQQCSFDSSSIAVTIVMWRNTIRGVGDNET